MDSPPSTPLHPLDALTASAGRRYSQCMRKIPHNRQPETLDPTGGLTDEDLDEIEKDPGFQRMADEADRAEREGRITPHEEVLKRNPPSANYRRKSRR